MSIAILKYLNTTNKDTGGKYNATLGKGNIQTLNLDKEEINRKEYKKQRKLYRKMNKKYRKQMLEMIKKHYGPWDNFLSNFFVIQAKHWVEYYELGFNVWGMEVCDSPEFREPNRPTRLEIAKELLRLYDFWQDYSPNWEVLKEMYGEQEDENGVPMYVVASNKEYERRQKSFFDYYMKYSGDMWD